MDRRALPAPDAVRGELASAYAPPQGPTERLLAGIWAAVLRVDRVGRHDNFFELGGDSIANLQIVARAGQSGLRILPRDLFRHQTVADLALVAETGAAPEAAAPAAGPAPLTPIQHHFLTQTGPAPQQFAQALLLDVRGAIDASALEEALRALLRHHDALRLTFTRDPAAPAGWRQAYAGPETAARLHLVHVDSLAAAEALAADLDLAGGCLLQAALIGERRLHLAVHHLAVDAVSWGILVADLNSAYAQAVAHRPVTLPPPTTAFGAWGAALQRLAAAEDAAYWLRQPLPAPLPLDPALPRHTVRAGLDQATTTALLQEVPPLYNTEINDALLTALARTLSAWSGAGSAHVQLEGHGREALAEPLDVSRTVGWFTSLFPVALAVGGTLEADLKGVKEQLRALPRRGLSYGMLRYLGPDDVRRALAARPLPAVRFNYLGRYEAPPEDGAAFVPAAPLRLLRHPAQPDDAALDVAAYLRDGALQVTWTARGVPPDTLHWLAGRFSTELRALVDHCRSAAGGFTPSDFDLAGLDQAELDDILAEFGEA